MRIRRRTWAALVAVAGGALPMLVLGACGLDKDGLASTAKDASVVDAQRDVPVAPVDATPDTNAIDAPAEAETDGGSDAISCDPNPVCNGACSTSTVCTNCSGAPLLCNASKECLANCTGCTGLPYECYQCPTGQPIGTCVSATQFGGCFNPGPNGYAACPCSDDDASSCPGDQQVCLGEAGCHSCGEPNTDGLTCRNSQKCDQDARACE